jgi:hypothetical protein
VKNLKMVVLPDDRYPQKLYPFEWGMSAIWFLMLIPLAWMGIFEEALTLGGRSIPRFYSGDSAVISGYFMLFAAILPGFWLLRLNRWKVFARAGLFLLLVAVCATHWCLFRIR